MKKLILLLVLTAIVGTFTYAVILRKNKADRKTETIKKEKQEKKKSRCSHYYESKA